MSQHRSYLKFYCLILIFLLPMIGSGLLYYFHDHFHFKTTNHGTLIRPAISLSELKIIQHKWQIIYMPTDTVDEHWIFNLNQLRKALGKDYERVSLTLITPTIYQIKQKNDFTAIVWNAKNYTQFQQLLPLKEQSSVTNKIYLIDPIGNVFMYYSMDAKPMDILKDIKHLLGVSQIG